MAIFAYGRLTFFYFYNLIEAIDYIYKNLMATCDYSLTFSHLCKHDRSYGLHL